jgi:hypothetical protein
MEPVPILLIDVHGQHKRYGEKVTRDLEYEYNIPLEALATMRGVA